MATRSGKQNPVVHRVSAAAVTMRLVRNSGKARRTAGKMAKRGGT